jgi:hypothetical protein
MVLDGFSKTQKLGMVGLLATIALVAIIGKGIPSPHRHFIYGFLFLKAVTVVMPFSTRK